MTVLLISEKRRQPVGGAHTASSARRRASVIGARRSNAGPAGSVVALIYSRLASHAASAFSDSPSIVWNDGIRLPGFSACAAAIHATMLPMLFDSSPAA